jgi:glycolate oxidase FAD binding subunit
LDLSHCLIDEFGPLLVTRPQSVAEVGDLVRRLGSERKAVYPIGGRTQLDIGLPPTSPGEAVDLRSLDAVVDYPARDMTVTVQAGVSVTALQALLAGEHQRLPIDVPHADRATLGGSLAANVVGPRRYGYGTWRDYVIGMSTVNDAGQETKAGGRVVKNVAGYDLPKLHIGALGTLGVITQVTLKLRPIPEAKTLLTFGCESSGLTALLDLLHHSATRPVCLDLLNRAAARAIAGASLPPSPWVVAVGFEDNADAVGWQVRQLIEELAPAAVQGLEARAANTCDRLWHGLVESTAPTDSFLAFAATMVPSAVGAFCVSAADLEGIRLHAHAGSGVVLGRIDGDLTVDRAFDMLKSLSRQVAAASGNLVIRKCPPQWKATLPVWGAPRNDVWLMRRVKDALDPKRLFNPGRFVDGI